MPVKEHSHFILAKGRYQVVALSQADEFDPDHIVAYDVLTTSGVRVRRELTLDEAKARVEILMKEERACRPSAMPPDRPRRERR